ncbi:MAG: DUF4093 domain-containing protein [Clostridia bacterium]|nr:DUF4093 domain-containing protein [Clostridia bacterium]
MLRIKEAVVVEGKHDSVRLAALVDAPIVVTNGFRIFKDPERVALLRRLAATRGLVILTDSDSAGFVIRGHLQGVIPPEQIKHAYCPMVAGKERRKPAPSKEGLLGVEGIDPAALEQALRRAGVTVLGEETPPVTPWMTKARLYADGLTGGENSAARRQALLRALGLPTYLSANRLVEVLNLTCREEEYQALIEL